MSPTADHDARLLELAYDSSDESQVPEAMRCKYPSKFCGHARAAKATGQLHRFCEIHRRRANVNQKRWTAVRRHDASTEPHALAHGQSANVTLAWDTPLPHYPNSVHDQFDHAPAVEAAFDAEPRAVQLNDLDMEILTALLIPAEACSAAPYASMLGTGRTPRAVV